MKTTPEDADWRPSRGRLGLWVLAVPAILFGIVALAAVLLTGREWALPDWAAERIEARLNEGLGAGGATLDGVIFEVDTEGVPRVKLRNVGLSDARGARVAQLNEVSARLLPGALIQGRVLPDALRVSGAQITVRRAANGAFTVSFGENVAPPEAALSGVLDGIEAAFAEAPVSAIESIEGEDLTITLEDARSSRVWQATGGTMRLTNGPDTVSITVLSEVFNGTEDLAEVQLSFVSQKASSEASIGVRIENAAAADIALQTPALAYLGVLDAQVSGSMRTTLGADGAVQGLAASLELGRGALQPTPDVRPLPFNAGRAYFDYDAAGQKITFSELRMESDALRLVGTGQAYLQEFSGGWPDTLLAQLQLSEISASPEGVFAETLQFERGAADFRMRLQPFSVDVGQVALEAGGKRLAATGRVAADEAGWRIKVDAAAPEMTTEQLLSLWPVDAVPGTRRWLERNVRAGRLENVKASVRLAPDGAPIVGVTYDFDGAEARYLPKMPPITEGRGSAALIGGRYAMRLASGHLVAASGTEIDLSGSAIRIADVDARTPRAEIGLRVAGPIGDILTVLDNEPLSLLQKSGRSADIAAGTALATARIGVNLLRDVEMEDVSFEVSGTLSDVVSTEIAPDRQITARELALTVNSQRMALSGAVALDGLPFDLRWEQPLDAVATGESAVSGAVALNAAFLETFGIAAPPGAVSGSGVGEVTLDLPREGAPRFRLTSDLVGIALSFPALGWSKPAAAPATFEIAGRLGPEAEIEALSLDAPGLAAEGTVLLGPDGTLDRAEFSRVAVGNWLEAPIFVENRGPGQPPAIDIPGGRIDLRQVPTGDGGGGQGVPLELALEALVLSDRISLSPFSGTLTAAQGLNGSFAARVNGGAALNGTLVARADGTVIRATGPDAGAILRDAGIFRSFEGGSFDLVLAPRTEGEGYSGQLLINTTVLGDQPVIAELLDAVSIVGIIDQLQGPGILFDTVNARFRLTPEGLTLDQGAAVGASLGISLDGNYDIENEELNMQGVISPIYILNAIGQVFTRQGEGLFGFTFQLSGDAQDPRLSVNPLSILAPGMLREIFRGGGDPEAAARQQLPRQEERREQP